MRRILLMVSMLFFVLLAVGCQSPAGPTPLASPVTEANSSPTDTAEKEPQPTTTELIEEPTPENTVTEAPTEIAVITPEPADECLECHQDKQSLIDTAKPEEEQVSESSGEG